MEASVLQGIKDWFRDYVGRFRDDEERLAPMMDLKVTHTARVALFCRTIAEQRRWSANRSNLAEAGGWLHDVGRFSQWADFGTYRDRDSVDHAARGHEVLLLESPLEATFPDERDALLDSVRLHNKLALPNSLSPSTRALCEVVRDADKLDIFDVVYEHLGKGQLGRLIPALSPKPYANPDIVRAIGHGHGVSYAGVQTQTDFLLISVSWAYELTSRAAAQMADAKNAIGRLAPHLPEDGGVQDAVAQAAAFLHRRAEGGASTPTGETIGA